jgi:hypothetical protein
MMEKLADKLNTLRRTTQRERRVAVTLMDLSYFVNDIVDKAIEISQPYDTHIAKLEAQLELEHEILCDVVPGDKTVVGYIQEAKTRIAELEAENATIKAQIAQPETLTCREPYYSKSFVDATRAEDLRRIDALVKENAALTERVHNISGAGCITLSQMRSKYAR